MAVLAAEMSIAVSEQMRVGIIFDIYFRVMYVLFEEESKLNMKTKHSFKKKKKMALDLSVGFCFFGQTTFTVKIHIFPRRYQTLTEPCQIRRDNLEEAHLLFQFYRDVSDELSWINEKRPMAASQDLGNSLTAVQNLQKKHQVSTLGLI